jgi:acyl transferase domain-containing protein
MGADLYAINPVFRAEMDAGDRAARARLGMSPLAAMADADKGVLNRLEVASPALFMTQLALARAVMAAGITPAGTLGISLGEFVAATVTGMADPDTAWDVVCGHPAVCARTCAPGGMTAFLGDPETVRALPDLEGNAMIAGINGPKHGVLAGPEAGLAAVEAAMESHRVLYQRLPVPYAFHSPWVDDAASGFRPDGPGLRATELPAWSCRFAAPLQAGRPDPWWEIVRGPMRVADTIAAIEARGGAFYLDLGPAATLASILRQTLPRSSPSRVVHILSPFGREDEAWAKALRALVDRGPAQVGSRQRIFPAGA